MPTTKTSAEIGPRDLERLERVKRASLAQVLFRAARLLNERAVRRLGDKGVPARLGHTSLLPHIDFKGIRLTELAARAGITKQAASQSVEEMEKQGVVRRDPDPDDARARQVRFTRKGFEALLQGLGELSSMEDELVEAMGRSKVDRLKALLTELLQVLESKERL